MCERVRKTWECLRGNECADESQQWIGKIRRKTKENKGIKGKNDIELCRESIYESVLNEAYLWKCIYEYEIDYFMT